MWKSPWGPKLINIYSLGGPEFKISMHSNKYMAEFGFDDYQTKILYNHSDNSLNFSVKDTHDSFYQGSMKTSYGEFFSNK